jgi:hypothetical protein
VPKAASFFLKENVRRYLSSALSFLLLEGDTDFVTATSRSDLQHNGDLTSHLLLTALAGIKEDHIA